ncbi:MAG: sensor histidine kinase [Thermoanaerobaculia bacterium]
MIRRPLLVAFAFAVSALVLFGALARITAMTPALERSERAALERATHEENVRIALWRLDATLAELIALENTRPAARFRSAAEPAGLPASGTAGLVRARFEVGPDRELRSQPALTAPAWAAALPVPEQPPRRRKPRSERPRPAPPAPEPDTVVAETAPEPVAPVAQEEPQAETVSQSELEKIPTARDPWALLQSAPGVLTDRINVGGNESGQQSAYTQEDLNALSFQRRQELARQSNLVLPTAPAGVEVESAFEARWMGGNLVLLRRVRRGDERLLQGTWLDWPALRAFLLARIEPVVPASTLEPSGLEADPGRRLALLPARLVPGPMPETEPRDWTPVRLSLAAAWAAAVLGLVGVGSLLKASVTLSQRRADFVSAVTHELRTPLTTFRLYTEMLADGMVPAQERPSYLAILKREADRLGHLVDNVLTFSRLERRAAAKRIEVLPLADLLERVVPRLRDRAAQEGLAFEVEGGAVEARVRVDVASAEQILLNLVDNACKYAPGQPLHLSASLRGRHAVLRLRDHGPGIDPRDRRRIFRPFHRSAARAAGSAPGVGLGLALSRRLARQMGGDLRLASSEEGASFELWLRAAKPLSGTEAP